MRVLVAYSTRKNDLPVASQIHTSKPTLAQISIGSFLVGPFVTYPLLTVSWRQAGMQSASGDGPTSISSLRSRRSGLGRFRRDASSVSAENRTAAHRQHTRDLAE